MHNGFDVFTYFMAVTAQIAELGKPVTPFTQKILLNQGVPEMGVAAYTFM